MVKVKTILYPVSKVLQYFTLGKRGMIHRCSITLDIANLMQRGITVLMLSLLIGIKGLYAEVSIGEPAPDFSLTDVKGQAHSLLEFKEKYVVLEWFNYDCPFVKKHYDSGNMQALQKEYTQKGVVWLSINSSAGGKQGHYSPDEMMKLSEEKKTSPTDILLDGEGQVGKLYGAQTTPHMFIINPEGVLIYQGAIDDNPSSDQQDIPGAKNYVKETLDQAMSGQPVTDSSTKSYGCSVKY